MWGCVFLSIWSGPRLSQGGCTFSLDAVHGNRIRHQEGRLCCLGTKPTLVERGPLRERVSANGPKPAASKYRGFLCDLGFLSDRRL